MDRRKALKRTGLLAGATVLTPTLFSLFQACKEEKRVDWQPEFLTQNEAVTVSSLLDTILPRTQTPGALDVKADIFIDKVIAHTYDEEGQKAMRADILAFNQQSTKAYGSNFANLNDDNKMAFLKEQEANSGKFNPGIWGTSVGDQQPIGFYRSMKSMAIWAYTTSQEIGENVLSYDPVPGVYEPCKPLSEVGNKWSL